jgi:hypothetical protein
MLGVTDDLAKVHGDGVELGLILVEAVDRLPGPHHLLGQRLFIKEPSIRQRDQSIALGSIDRILGYKRTLADPMSLRLAASLMAFSTFFSSR